jgi:tight adherence protein B
MNMNMVPTLATFATSLLIVLGVYWLFVMLPEMRSSRRLRQRLKPGRVEGISGVSNLTRRDPAMSALKGLDRALGQTGSVLNPLRLMVERSGLPITIELILIASLVLAGLGFAAVLVLTKLLWFAIVVAIAASAVPFIVVRIAEIRRVQQFEDQFPQAIDLIASSLRAGHAFTTGVLMVADEVQDPLGAEFRLLYDQQNYGMPLPDGLKAFARRVPLLDARFFITAVLTQREAGGNLAEVLDNLSNLIRERSRVRRQVRVASAHGRITGWVLSAMPPILAGVMMVVAPEHMRGFVSDPLGVRMIIAALFLQVIGTLAIRRIVNVEY